MDHVPRTPAQLGKVLRSCRKLRGLTQQQVAAAVGIKQATVSTAEQGSGGLSAATLYKILSALGLELVVRDAAAANPARTPRREW